jgi:FHA domain
MKEFFAKLTRLFQPAMPPAAEPIEQPSADRPPPPEPASSLPPASAEVGVVPDDVSEIRALLEAVAEAPPSSAEPEAGLAPPAPEPETNLVPEAPEPATLSPQTSTQADVVGPSRVPERVGDALVLTLATPATTFTVAKMAATIGRGQENTIRLDDLSVSRRHARIAFKQGGYWLSDLGSMGGTWVDGTRLNAPHLIASGQIIDIGLCRLTVSSVGAGAKDDPKKAASKTRSEMAGQARRRR